MTIIESDIQSYTAFAETEQSRLQRCAPKDEAHYKARWEAAKSVVQALHAYKAATEQPTPSETLNWS